MLFCNKSAKKTRFCACHTGMSGNDGREDDFVRHTTILPGAILKTSNQTVARRSTAERLIPANHRQREDSDVEKQSAPVTVF
jgi:hypothetical protein